MKVLHVSHSLRPGGLETFIADLVGHGLRHGVQPVVATLEHRGRIFDELAIAGVPVRFLGKRVGLDWSVVGAVAALARHHGSDLIHAHNTGAGLYSALAGLRDRLPVVMTRHSLSTGDGCSGRILRRLAAGLCTITVCVSAEIAQQAFKEDKTPRRKLYLVMNGVDLARFHESLVRRGEARTRLGLNENDRVVMTVGRLTPVKNQALMLRAVNKLALKRPSLRLVFVGDGPERKRLEALAEALGLPGRVVFAGDRPDVNELLCAADCFLLSSDHEGAPKALLEAMASSLPIVSTAVGGVPDMIGHGHSGLLAPRGDHAALAARLAQVLDDPALANALGRAARREAERRFSLDQMARQYLHIYATALSRRPKAR